MNSTQSTPGFAPLTQLPRQGFGGVSSRMEDVLLLCFYDPVGISTVPETVAFMQSASIFPVTVLNLFEHKIDTGYLKLHPWTNLDRYSAIIIHNTVSYNSANLEALDSLLGRKLKDFRGVKVLMRQDENHSFAAVARFIGATGFDVVFTCLPPEAVPLIYPPEVVGTPVFERMLTGYVTPTLRARRFWASERPIDIGYRGSLQPVSFGWLAYEKRLIGDAVATALHGRGLALDISSRWEDRFGGDAWFEFLSSCKATLGAESGASIFDLVGDLDERCAKLESKYQGISDERRRTEAVLLGLKDLEGNVRYHQISPRHFEAAACGTVQLLYPGEYSGLFVAGRHYFELQRDHSNLDDAVRFIRNESLRNGMAKAAFEEVILNEANWIESFVERVDAQIDHVLREKSIAIPALAIAPVAHHVLLLAAHDPVIDPRLRWIEEGAPTGLMVHQLGVLPPEAQEVRQESRETGSLLWAYPRKIWGRDTNTDWAAIVADSPAGMAGAQELFFIERALAMDEAGFAALFGAPPENARNVQFRWYLQYVLDTAATLISAASAMRGVHAVIATDLDTMPAALVIKAMLGVPLLYDAHEYWAEADVASMEYERQFWVALERRMVAHADDRQTVSPGLAALMTRQYGVPFRFVPNCEPHSSLLPVATRVERPADECHFLFQGNFAEGRGIDLLIKAWPATDSRAILQLRGPENAFKAKMRELASASGLAGTRIVFPDAVPESELVGACSAADVGVIPYARSGANYRYCCPNKMSQYMAAGLPILANVTEFVAETVKASGCGVVVEFSRRSQLVDAVAEFCASPRTRSARGEAGREYFNTTYNWNIVSEPMYMSLHRMTSNYETEAFRCFSPDSRAFISPDTATAVLRRNLGEKADHLTTRKSMQFRMARFLSRCVPTSMRAGLKSAMLRFSSHLDGR